MAGQWTVEPILFMVGFCCVLFQVAVRRQWNLVVLQLNGLVAWTIHFFTNLSYNHPTNWGVTARIEYESGRRYTRSIIQDTVIINGKEFYDGPREDDQPYAYLALDPKRNVNLNI